MRAVRGRLLSLVVASATVLALVAPAPAVGLGGMPRASLRRAGIATRQGQLVRPVMRQRIERVLARRKARFDAVTALLSARLDRLESIATTLAAAGGDVTSARDFIDKSRTALVQAEASEAQAVTAFQAIPDQDDKRVAFRAAMVTGRSATRELNEARMYSRRAVAELLKVVAQIKAGER